MNKDIVYMCPKCGSTEWKFPNPLKASESMINLPSMVSNLFECEKCGNVGIFFEVHKNEVKDIQEQLKK